MHGLATKCRSIRCGRLAPSGYRPMIAPPKIQSMVDMAVEPIRSVIPGSRPDKYAARKPLWPIVSVGSAGVRRRFVISVRANRSNAHTDTHGNARGTTSSQHKSGRDRSISQNTQSLHDFARWLIAPFARAVILSPALLIPNPESLPPPPQLAFARGCRRGPLAASANSKPLR